MRGSLSKIVVPAALFALALAACDACRPGSGEVPGGAQVAADTGSAGGPATARLVLLTDLAGALEPCGCVKDQLGGLDHLGALVRGEAGAKVPTAVLSAGPLFFMDERIEAPRKEQDLARAETLASGLKALGWKAHAPGRNDEALGAATLGALGARGGVALLGATAATHGDAGGAAAAAGPVVKGVLTDVGGLRLGVVGVGAAADGASLDDVPSRVKAEAERLGREGARATVALVALGRGPAKRVADAVPSLLAVVVGSSSSRGEANTTSAPVEKVGEVLVLEPANHGQAAAVLELFDRGAGGFADGTGDAARTKREDLTRRAQELREKIATWEKVATSSKSDLEARRRDLAALEAQLAEASKPSPAPKGSFVRVAQLDVRADLGVDAAIQGEMAAYYERINARNKVLFAGRKPEAAEPGKPSYVGVEACTSCHEAPRKVWDATSHAHAYATLEKGHKEFNLDCVSCHVTGYDKPGGSTVTFVDSLKNVQCETCHGPGSLHAKAPDKAKIPMAHPGPDVCLACHHPPHVHTFDAAAKIGEVLGPGHGRPLR